MIRFFNVNNPSVAVFLLLYVFILNLVIFIQPEKFVVVETHAPFARLFFTLTDLIFNNNKYALGILAVILIFTQSLMLNSLVSNARLFETVTFVPAIIYALVACLFRDFLFLTPALLSMTFIILALGKSLRFFKQHHCYADVFDMGFLIAAASLFYMPAFLLFVLLFVALTVMRAFNWREWVIGLCGFLTMYFLTGAYYYLTDGLGGFIQHHILSASPEIENNIKAGIDLPVVGGFTGILLIAALLMFIPNFLKSVVQARKFFALTGWTFLLLGLSALFSSAVSLSDFLVLAVPLSIVISYLFMNIRRVKIANALHFVWLALVLFFHYYSS